MSNIVDFAGFTKNDIEPNKVLDGAPRTLETVMVAGWDENGELYVASNTSNCPELLWLMRVCEKHLVDVAE